MSNQRVEKVHQDLKDTIARTKVSYKRLGNSGLKVSLPILGAMSFGSKDWLPWVVEDEAEVEKLLKGAYDLGLNTWDTANIYSNGVSEEHIGRVVKKLNIPRNKLIILTKCFATCGEDPSIRSAEFPGMTETADYVNKGGLSRAAIFDAVDASLKRLQMDYIDLLQIHRFDKDTPIEETMQALHDLVRSGKVRYIGASSMWAYQFAQMQFCAEQHNWTKFVSMQNHYSLCYREEEREMNKFCHETGVGLIPWGPLYAGLLARPLGTDKTARESNSPKDLTDAEKEIINRVEKMAKEKDWKMSQVALAWIVQKNTIPIVGFSSVQRIEEACAVNGKTLTEEEVKHLEEPYQPRAIQGHS